MAETRGDELTMSEQDREVRDLYRAYEHKTLKPETALELVSDFVLDLINVFGDELNDKTALKEGWRRFAPFEFILELNALLGRYKDGGYETLDEGERAMLADHGVLFGALVRSALTSHPDAFPDEEHFQIPDAVATRLLVLTESA